MLLLLIVIILSIPSVQTYIAKKVTKNLNETYGTSIHIKRLGLNWKGEVDIREVFIEDHHKDTLIYTKQLNTNILSFKNLIAGDLDFGAVSLKKPFFNLKVYNDEPHDNLFVFTEKFRTDSKSEEIFHLDIEDLELTSGRFSYTDENLENPDVIGLTNLELTSKDFSVVDEDVKTVINSMSFNSDLGFDTKMLQGNFSYTPTKMELKNLTLNTLHSNLTGEVSLSYSEENGLSFFEDNVTIDAVFNDSKISTNDLNGFYNEFGKDQLISIDGSINGTLNNFTTSGLTATTGNTRIKGDFNFKNLLSDQEPFKITASNHNIAINYFDLKRFMPQVIGESLPEELKSFGAVRFSGTTILTEDTLDTTGAITTNDGGLNVDLSLGNIRDFDNAFYSGDIALNNFNLSKISGTTSVGSVTANLSIDGRGFTQKTVNSKVTGLINSFDFEGYSYKNIEISGNLKNPLFNGKLSIDDPNLKMNFNGLVDVSKNFNQYDFKADIEYAELNKLNLIKRDSVSVFAGTIVMDMDGTTVDDAIGTIVFNETFYQNERDDFYFDDFKITSTFSDSVRTIAINSTDIIDGKISGKFLVKDVPDLFRNSVGSIYTNFIPNAVTSNQFINYEFEINNKLVELFVPQLQLGENTRVKGEVSSDESKFKLNFKSPEIVVLKNYLGKVNIQVDNDNPLFNTFIAIDSVDTGFYNITDVNLINKTLKDTLYLRSEFKGGKNNKDLFNLSLFHTINPQGKSVVGLKKSDITYNDKVWFLNEKNDKLNKVSFDDNFSTVIIDSLVLNHNQEYIKLAGVLRDSTYKDLKMKFQDVNVGNLIPKVDSLSLRGILNGKLDFLQKNGAYFPNADATVSDININDVEFGNLKLEVIGNENLSKYNINSTLEHQNVTTVEAIGDIDVAKENPQINMNVALEDFNLQALSPFGEDVITNIRGFASGNVKATGNYKSPDLRGRLLLDDSGLSIPFLNTDFKIDNASQVIVNTNELIINQTGIIDTKHNTEGIFSGSVKHTNFSDWGLDLDITTDRLLVLDTPPDDDALYYGTAFISGSAAIEGPIDELVIGVTATTEEGTSFKIPLSDTEAIGDDSFIKFLSPEEKKARISGETVVREDIKGLSLDFDLDINDKAEVEVVVDPVNNSKLKGRGIGTLLIRINTLGAFNMWGEFTVIEGDYDFRYGGLIQKTIAVEPGGFISWEGIPERARLDLSAKYTTTANPSILLDNPSVNRKIPVEVLIDLTGEIIQPEIDFRINFPQVSSIVRSELDYKLQNDEEREKQALLLISSDSFVGDDFAGAGSFAANTIANRVSSLVNDIFADQDSKFDWALSYEASNRTPTGQNADRIGISVSTQINERILINGKVGVPVGGVNETAVAGDIEVQWLVNKDGSLRINFFNRQADIQFIGEEQIFEQGAGLSYSVDFDTFKELVNKFFNKKITLENQELPVTPDDNSFPVNFKSDGENEE